MASKAQKECELYFQETYEAYAKAEAEYRQELAKETLRLRVDGMAATLIPDLAKGNERVSSLRLHRDVQKGLLDSASQRSWRVNHDRRDVQRFIDWSMGVSRGVMAD
jgi:hypothetical protein